MLVLGIGGGGDVVGALALGRRCEQLGTAFRLGGVAWERLPVDPQPGPRPAHEIAGGRRIATHAVLAGPETTTNKGVHFSESHVAAHLGEETALIDISGGAVGTAAAIAAAADELGCDLVLHVDIGGDAIACGSEPGLASPLCDSVMLAAALRLGGQLPQLAAVLGAGCDGELELDEVLGRVAAIARGGAWTSTWSPSIAIADELTLAAAPTGTEASLQVARSARGELGDAEIRQGRRTVRLSPIAALAFCFDPIAAAAELPMARAVRDSTSIEAARRSLADLGIRTELDYERERAAELAAPPSS